MMRYVRIMLLASGLFIQPDDTAGQIAERIHKQFRFKYITVDQGLSNNMVISICQDSYGFIWYGTSAGLNKFDGYELTNYFHNEKDTTSISGDRVEIVYCDSRKTLWIGTLNGLSTFNYETNSFVPFTHSSIPDGIGRINDIDEDAEGILWMASWNGLIKYDPQKNTLEQYRHETGNPSSIPHNNLTNIVIDRDNNPWISTFNQGIAKFDRKTGTCMGYRNDPDDPESISEDRIESIYADHDGNVWFGTYNKGLNLFEAGTGKFRRFYPDYTVTGSGRVRAIFEDPKDNFWIGTQTGLYLFNQGTGTFYRYAYTDHPFSTLGHNSIQCALIDNTEILWLGTFAGGVSYRQA